MKKVNISLLVFLPFASFKKKIDGLMICQLLSIKKKNDNDDNFLIILFFADVAESPDLNISNNQRFHWIYNDWREKVVKP